MSIILQTLQTSEGFLDVNMTAEVQGVAIAEMTHTGAQPQNKTSHKVPRDAFNSVSLAPLSLRSFRVSFGELKSSPEFFCGDNVNSRIKDCTPKPARILNLEYAIESLNGRLAEELFERTVYFDKFAFERPAHIDGFFR